VRGLISAALGSIVAAGPWGESAVNRVLLGTLLALLLPASTPVFAAPVRADGITPQEMVEIMTARGLPARINHDSNGALIVSSRVADVNFDVYFYQCENSRCRDIQFAAGWNNTHATPERVNEWNTTKRFVRVYWKPGNIVWAEQDARISRGTTENIDEQLALWPQMLLELKKFMRF
jgi:hypothetical protein